MTKVETIQAARALEAWLKTQVSGPERAIVVAYYLAFETVAQSTRADFSLDLKRLEVGTAILSGIYQHFVDEIAETTKDLRR